jgi:N-acetylglucosaminyldiphosphoundecaprenol N-acetyl-beta-D-mannosaminyltransferase
MDKALRKVEDMIERGDRPQTVLAVNPEKELSVPKDSELHEMFRKADMLIPDGVGVVLAAKALHGSSISRVPGCELMQRVCGLAAEKGYPVYVYGAKPEVNEKAVEEVKRMFPGIKVAGSSHGYVPPEGMKGLVEDINSSEAKVLFVAMGSPRQEKWMLEHMPELKNVRVCQGIGGTLDILSGNIKRAPEFYCRLGLEWLYRLVSEPKRLKRQSYYQVFALKVIARKLLGNSRSQA